MTKMVEVLKHNIVQDKRGDIQIRSSMNDEPMQGTPKTQHEKIKIAKTKIKPNKKEIVTKLQRNKTKPLYHNQENAAQVRVD